MNERAPSLLSIEYPNLDAKVCFVITYPFQFYVFKNVYRHIAKDAEFVIDLGVYFPVRQPNELLADMVRLLEKHKVYYRVLRYEDYYADGKIESFLGKYRAIVALWEQGCMAQKYDVPARKITMMYGCGKELTFLRPTKRFLDLSLSFGERGNKLLSYYTKSIVVGNAKFDDWFTGTLDNKEITAITSILDKNKRTLLYLPTHGDLCSIEALARELAHITDEFNVLVKLHYLTAHEEPEKVALLSHIPGITLYNDDTDLLPLLHLADAVLSDNSSAIFESILAKKPTVVVDLINEDFLDGAHRVRRSMRRGSSIAVTYSGSNEQEIKRNGGVVTLTDVAKLREKLNEAMRNAPEFLKRQERVITENFSYNDGKCGERAAEAILECMNEEPPEKPILAHAYEVYKDIPYIRSAFPVMANMFYTEFLHARHMISGGESSPSVPFSVILADTDPESLEGTLTSLLWQKYPVDSFEIFLFSHRDPQELRTLIDAMVTKVSGPHPRITGVEIHAGENLVHAISKCVESMRGDFVCFTRSGIILPSDWLLSISLAHKQYPHAIGIGGCTTALAHSVHTNWYTQYYLYALSRKLGVERFPVRLGDLFPVCNRLFRQNPFGDLSNAAYARAYLAGFRHEELVTDSWELVELMLKSRVVEAGEVLFMPIAVEVVNAITKKEFRAWHARRGAALAALQLSDRALREKSAPSVSRILQEVSVALFGVNRLRSNWRLVIVVAQANFYEWVGYRLYAAHRWLARRTKSAR